MKPAVTLALLLLATGAPLTRAGGEGEPKPGPLLLANYYTWYATGGGPHKIWTHWVRHDVADRMNREARQSGETVSTLGHEEIASVDWPLAGLYDSDDREIVRWHIRLAQAAGIDAFLVDWWGPGDWQRVPRLTQFSFEDVVLPIAAEEGFRVALMDETAQFRGNWDEVKAWAVEYLSRYKDHPAYLRIDGKPVYYLYQVPFNPSLTPEKFADLRDHVEERVGAVYWIVDAIANGVGEFRIPEQWRPVDGIDAFSFYGTFSIFREYKYEDLVPRYRRVVEQAHAAGKKMVLPVHPGHDNAREGNPNRFKMPRREGETLRGYLRAATEAGADFVMVTSFNEWPETTGVEPSSSWSDPYLYLKILAQWKGIKFKLPEEPARVREAQR
jgi:hypothetical protein